MENELLKELIDEIKSMKQLILNITNKSDLSHKESIPNENDRYIGPKEVMDRLSIGRSKLDQWANEKFIIKIKPDPNTKKIYFKWSNLNEVFPGVFPHVNK